MSDDDTVPVGGRHGLVRMTTRVDDEDVARHVVAGRYEIVALLGAGGMGRVYRAYDRELDETVALKMLHRSLSADPAALERFRQEVKLARKVTSSHVVRTFDLGRAGDDSFLTMELVEGKSLAATLAEQVLRVDEVLRIARAVAAGIATAHAAGVLHRDLKPDNILVGSDGRIAITDFGIARSASVHEQDDCIVGTPAYMAPEQRVHNASIGPAVDIYAFGTILCEMLTGQRTWDDAAAVPESLGVLARACLVVDPALRIADGRALVTALETAIERTRPTTIAVTAHARPTTPVPSARAIALLPIRAPADLVELGDGIAEEIIDTLAMTRALRVRASASVRAVHREGSDPLATGARLGVDVIVDSAIRRLGDSVRISARAISVADGFQIWARAFDTTIAGLLATADELARAIAGALTAELAVPDRAAIDPLAAVRYLEAKAALRANWMVGDVEPARIAAEAALAFAPDDAGTHAVLSLALARIAAVRDPSQLARATELAQRATVLGPALGEAHLALGIAQLYRGAIREAAAAFARAVELAPGLAMAQASLGALHLEADDLDGALAHLAAAYSIDPAHALGVADYARALIYADRFAEADALLAVPRDSFHAVARGRFRAWRGESIDTPLDAATLATLPVELAQFVRIVGAYYRDGSLARPERAAMIAVVERMPARIRVATMQFAIEALALLADRDAALDLLERALRDGLHDLAWIRRCPALDPIREAPRFIVVHAAIAAKLAQ